MESTYGECFPDLSFSNEDKGMYHYGWAPYNESHTPDNGMGLIYDSFQYKTAESLNSTYYQGTYSTYPGGGFVYQMRGQLSYLIGNISLLQQNNWIDRSTKAVFIEFSAFNPNINLVIVATLLVEFLPSGNVISTPRFDSVNMVDSHPSLTIFLLVMLGVFVAYYVYLTAKGIYAQKFAYIKQFWTIVDLILISLIALSIKLFIDRISAVNVILDIFKKTNGYGYVKLQDVNNANQLIVASLSTCVALVTIKFLQLFRFNNNIYMLALTLNRCSRALMGFGFVFGVILLAYVQLMFLVYKEIIMGYSSIIRSMSTSFELILGKFSLKPILQNDKLLGMFIFISFNVIIVIILMNALISIVCDAFAELRFDLLDKPNDFEMFKFFKNKLKSFFTRSAQQPLSAPIEDENECSKNINDNLPLVLKEKVENLVRILGIVSIYLLASMVLNKIYSILIFFKDAS